MSAKIADKEPQKEASPTHFFDIKNLWQMWVFIFLEAVCSFFVVFIPLSLGMLWTPHTGAVDVLSPTVTGPTDPIFSHSDPSHIFSVTVLLVYFSLFINNSFPGVTGHPLLLFVSFLFELVSYSDTWHVVAGKFVKTTLALFAELSAACLAGRFAASFFPSDVILAHKNQRFNKLNSTDYRDMIMEALLFGLFVWAFERFHRLLPNGEQPYAVRAVTEPKDDADLSSSYRNQMNAFVHNMHLSVMHFVVTFLAYALMGSTLNFLVPLATYFTVDSWLPTGHAQQQIWRTFTGEAIAIIVVVPISVYLYRTGKSLRRDKMSSSA